MCVCVCGGGGYARNRPCYLFISAVCLWQATIDVLKMDIEHSEWPAMMDILAKGELSHVRQLLMEYHLFNSGAQDIRERMPILKQIEDLGFRRFYTHLNPMCGPLNNAYPVMRTTCYETYYVNTRFARTAPAE